MQVINKLYQVMTEKPLAKKDADKDGGSAIVSGIERDVKEQPVEEVAHKLIF